MTEKDVKDLEDKLKIINQSFSPSAPIEQRDLFFGRLNQISDIEDTISEKGLHCVLYGERGVGKTSLANIIQAISSADISVKVTCNRNDTFKTMWAKALSKITFWQTHRQIGFTARENNKPHQLNLFLPDTTDINSTDLENIFELLENDVLIIFDEFDSITDKNIKEQFADTIKSLSDNVGRITILIVGIAQSVNDLIGNHQSLERCLKQVHLPTMSREELGEIVDYGFEKAKLKIEHIVRKKIIDFSSGFPHYTHLLSKYCGQIAIKRNGKMIVNDDFDESVVLAIQNTHQQVRQEFQNAIITSKEVGHFENVLYAIACCEKDEFDSSTANEIVSEFNRLAGLSVTRESLTYHLGTLCKPERGEVLVKVGGSKNIKYKFRSPMFKNFVQLNWYKKRLIK